MLLTGPDGEDHLGYRVERCQRMVQSPDNRVDGNHTVDSPLIRKIDGMPNPRCLMGRENAVVFLKGAEIAALILRARAGPPPRPSASAGAGASGGCGP